MKADILLILLVVHFYLNGKTDPKMDLLYNLTGSVRFRGFFTLSSPEGIQITAKNIVSSSVRLVNTNQV